MERRLRASGPSHLVTNSLATTDSVNPTKKIGAEKFPRKYRE